jgi:hypothetical protein
MTDEDKKTSQELFDRICRCLEIDGLDLKFVVHQTPGKWFHMTVFPVGDGDGHVVFDLKKLVRVFDGTLFAGSLHLAQDHKLKLIGEIEGRLFHVTFRQEWDQ